MVLFQEMIENYVHWNEDIGEWQLVCELTFDTKTVYPSESDSYAPCINLPSLVLVSW